MSSTPGIRGRSPPPASGATQRLPHSRVARREYAVWDPRSAPGTYLLLAINVAVYLWMVLHHVDPMNPHPARSSTTAPT